LEWAESFNLNNNTNQTTMKIDTDLRLTIRSAEKAQPADDWQVRAKRDDEAIAAFLASHPAKAKKIQTLIATARKAEAQKDAAHKELCEAFGLKHYNNKLEFSRCGDGKDLFVKAGGKLPSATGRRWKFDEVIAELAKAEGKQATAILKKYGINWK
jgi:hypothetical protein